MKIYDWRKFLTFIAILIFLLIVALYGCTRQEPKLQDVQEHTVISGETLWSIAKAYCPSNMSIQEYVYKLRELNNCDDCLIYPNEVLQILIYEEA